MGAGEDPIDPEADTERREDFGGAPPKNGIEQGEVETDSEHCKRETETVDGDLILEEILSHSPTKL